MEDVCCTSGGGGRAGHPQRDARASQYRTSKSATRLWNREHEIEMYKNAMRPLYKPGMI